MRNGTSSWLRKGALILHKVSGRLAEVVEVNEDGTSVVEYDDDGTVHDTYATADLLELFEPWQEGRPIVSRTGKGRFVKRAE